eukprot:CAMPEP_0119321080 /NCGR_PEP_ID=MMETSP1333-20130426/54344_1 /TAXON_ID=418940 /ORGANISM="Scyphosphaera apsteinii, Strain RCC1455" /LENGTH=179 /DNA_ID=CAMNT_0007327953 /DNA_START=464 /DNA_END=999 /DNA_ORIENTATION=+
MDHFCPWVVNTVGFYNRKFFLLFLIYTCLTLFYTLIATAPRLPAMFEWALELGEKGRWLPGIANAVVLVVMLVVDVILLALLVPFLVVHLRMAVKNQTTIDGDRFPQYDLGPRRNLQQVFGSSLAVWWLPLYFKGPDGDGVHWPCKPEVTVPASCSHGLECDQAPLTSIPPTEQAFEQP